MSFESLMTNCQSLKSSMEALAAIGAELRLRREKLSGDSRVRPLLQEVIHHIDPKLLDELDANQEEAALALIHFPLPLFPGISSTQLWSAFTEHLRQAAGSYSGSIHIRQVRWAKHLRICGSYAGVVIRGRQRRWRNASTRSASSGSRHSHPRLPLCSCSVSGRPDPDLIRHEKVFVKRSLRSTNTNCF